MASFATFAAVQPAAVRGLGGSSLKGTKLLVKPSRQSFKHKNYRAGSVVAKYGDKSVYFDLEDIGNTTGQWDLYGSDAPSLQSKFFETFAAPFTKRGLLLKFLILGGGSLGLFLSAIASEQERSTTSTKARAPWQDLIYCNLLKLFHCMYLVLVFKLVILKCNRSNDILSLYIST
ncbi:Photosystem I reaction center subunit VI [Hibiscus syriacus]|uniref:Photosystem I reaction center subunit VI n=1 Tax=Hibiscus syriacus TaxID=106335 RepID=A0A6A3ACK1_HIBSY|nr:Photosystem I reaction center subunit VI [Hibiscus syriacus]